MAEEKQRHGGGGGGGGGGGIVKVEPKPNKGLSSKVIDFVEKLMVKFMYQNNNHSSQPHHFLSGTFTPVCEETPPTTNLLVKGHLPVSTTVLCVHSTLTCHLEHFPIALGFEVQVPLLAMTLNAKYVLQECLNGEFVRVGPNPKFTPVAGYHWYVSFVFSSCGTIHYYNDKAIINFHEINV